MSGANTVMFAGIPVDVSELNLNFHSSRVASVKTANITLIVLVGFFVALRLFVRLHIVRKIFADDGEYICEYSLKAALIKFLVVLIVVAATFTIALASVCLAGMFWL